MDSVDKSHVVALFRQPTDQNNSYDADADHDGDDQSWSSLQSDHATDESFEDEHSISVNADEDSRKVRNFHRRLPGRPAHYSPVQKTAQTTGKKSVVVVPGGPASTAVCTPGPIGGGGGGDGDGSSADVDGATRCGTRHYPNKGDRQQSNEGIVAEETSSQQQQHINLQQEPEQIIMPEDVEIFQRLDREYERALEEREVSYNARYLSVRQSACFAVSFMLVYLLLGVIFFLKQTEGDWSVEEAIFFSVYTITTVGYGNLRNPETPSFQLYTIFFIFIGIATLTIMVAQVYQCLALEASRAQHEQDSNKLHSLAAAAVTVNPLSSATGAIAVVTASWLPHHHRQTADSSPSASAVSSATTQTIMYFGDLQRRVPMLERAFACFERLRTFLRENEYGRGISVLFPFLGLIIVGATVIGTLEGWTVIESLYFSVVSLTTVGFGDYHPTRTASIWFAILWLPFSIGFMSLFLTNVAAFYIRLSDRNIHRIESQLRRRLRRAKQQAEKERRAARRRALRGQYVLAEGLDGSNSTNHTPILSSRSENGDQEDSTHVEEEDGIYHNVDVVSSFSNTRQKGLKGFSTLPTDDGSSPAVGASRREQQRSSSNELFGSPGAMAVNRRERIMKNSITGHGRPSRTLRALDSLSDDENQGLNLPQRQTRFARMGDVVRTVRIRIADGQSTGFRSLGPDSQFLSIRSVGTVTQSFQGAVRKPSFALRVLVLERFAEIIAFEIAGFQNSVEIQENTLSVTIDSLHQTADKWLIPRRARKAFRSVAFEALYFVGEHGLITRGAEALYDLTPFEFHILFSPLLAAMGDAEIMEAWLAQTHILADVDLRKDRASNRDDARGVEQVISARGVSG